MPDYKEMSLTMFRAAEEAVNLLIAAQQQCEELYVGCPEEEGSLPQPAEENSPVDGE